MSGPASDHALQGEISKFIDRVIEHLRSKANASMDKKDPDCTFNDLWNRMDADERNGFPSFQRKNFITEVFARRIRDNPKVQFDETTKTFRFKKQFTSPDDLVRKLYVQRSGVEDKEDLHDDVQAEHIKGLVAKNLLRLVEIKENKTKTIRVLLSRNDPEDAVEQMELEEKTPLELIGYWEEYDKTKQQADTFQRGSARQYLDRDPKMTVKALGKRKRRFFDDTDVTRWQNQHLIDKIEDALDVLEKQTAPELRTLKRSQKLKAKLAPRSAR